MVLKYSASWSLCGNIFNDSCKCFDSSLNFPSRSFYNSILI